MSEDVSQVLGAEGAGLPVIGNGNTYFLEPITQRHKSTYEAWLKERALRSVYEQRDNLDADEYTDLHAKIHENIAAGVYGWAGAVWRKSMRGIDGVVQLAWMLAKTAHPKVTLEEIRNAVMDNPTGFGAAIRSFLDADPNTRPPKAAGAN